MAKLTCSINGKTIEFNTMTDAIRHCIVNNNLIKEEKDYPEAKRVQDAQRILVKEYGAKAKEVAVKKDILEFSKNINVTFSSLQ